MKALYAWLLPIFVASLAAPAPVRGTEAARAEEAHPLSLDEAVERALENDDDILVARESLVSAASATDGARGAYDPLLEVEAGWRETGVPVNSAFSGAPAGRLAPTERATAVSASLRRLLPTGGEVTLRAGADRLTSNSDFTFLSPAYGSELAIELRQPLLRDRKMDDARLGLRVAAADHSRSAAELRATVAVVVAEVERAYWDLVAACHAVEVQADTVRLAEEQLEETEIRISEGAAPESEIAQPRAEVERRRGEFFAAQEAQRRAENAVKLLIVGDDEVDMWTRRLLPEASDEVTRQDVDLVASLEQALVGRPEIEAARALVDRRRAQAESARDSRRPKLDAVASYGRFGLAGTIQAGDEVPPQLGGDFGDSLGSLGDGDFEDTRLGLVLSLPIGNRAAHAAAEQAAAFVREAEIELRRTRKQIRVEVLDAAATVETAAQRIEAARAALAAAEVQLDAERERYAVGLSTNFLVLTRQNDLANSRLQEIAAIADYRTARAAFERATASLLARHGIQWAADEPTTGSLTTEAWTTEARTTEVDSTER